ncbi:tetratricopeptide repeat protein [Aureibaculum sp. 2210JD6-5]|uniref:tetratricopeptide repeat protein n=1 Tax=Aureibaculum sp. 2210JD6-5 TaxID=3103957 RepID=UPI002AAEFCB4|nr:tetratricopeptide repeat protein [Aureibaculum sp. 2210JD6-5]MDY7396621.1 tetratricopeptide repeat protein [Aureibaculum sp. 2210JD6-5]
MKKLVLLVLAIFIGLSSFAQKDELKDAEKAIKKEEWSAAKASVDKAEGLIANADEKLKAKFYFLKAQTYYNIGKKQPAMAADAYDVAAKSFQDLISFEKEIGKQKYTEEAQPMLNALVADVSNKGIKEYQDKDYASAKKTLYQTYNLSKKDTVFLEYAATAAYLDKDFDTSLEYFNALKDLGYTGIATTYSAINTETNETENFSSKSQMDLMVKTGKYKDAKSETSESKRADVIKNIALILVEKGETENAIDAVKEARKANPDDADLIFTEANIQLNLGNKDEFAALMKEAIQQDPTNPSLHFNIGVINQEQGRLEEAKANYEKAIELDPNYADAHLNMGALVLEKDKELVEEMNKNLSNFKKYDEIKAKQMDLYKQALPYFEKAHSIKKDNLDVVRTLMSMYENLEMDDKYKEMKALWDASK